MRDALLVKIPPSYSEYQKDEVRIYSGLMLLKLPFSLQILAWELCTRRSVIFCWAIGGVCILNLIVGLNLEKLDAAESSLIIFC